MTYVHRLKAAGATLALAAVLTNAHVWGEAAAGSPAGRHLGEAKAPSRPTQQDAAKDVADDLANSKFAQGGLLVYRTTGGENLFALQVKPRLEPASARPRDYLVMVDTSASQVKGPLAAAQAITESLVKCAGDHDRVAIWTVNIPAATADLTRGFRAPKSIETQAALATLRQETPLGDTDLKNGLEKAIAHFPREAGRQQVIIFLGDGLSVHNPMAPADRTRLSEEMVRGGIAFFPVPLGPRFDPGNLHGLATGTGGAVVRTVPTDKSEDTVKRLQDAVATPVLYPRSFRLGDEVTEAFPTALPPLRGDAPTLVVGRLKSPTAVSYTLEGVVDGREVRLQANEPIADGGPDNFFLVSMVEQWKNGKDQPALTRADRVLAYAFEQGRLAREELLAQAEWALGQDKYEAAESLFKQARNLDPSALEADAGLKLIQQLKAGVVTKDQLRDQLAKEDKNGLQQLAQANPQPPPPRDIAPPTEPGNLLEEQRRRNAVEEQRVTQSIEEAQRQARRLLPVDPDAAYDLLKRAYASVRDNPDLSERVRQILDSRLQSALRSTQVQGVRIRQDREEQLRLLADSRRRFDLEQARLLEEERIRARMRTFDSLMAQARYEEAYLHALGMQQDAISSGRGVPPAVTAGYYIGLTANNLSQIQELKRVREERFLLTMMQVERSHVPFPDEPPIQFPPAATWIKITQLRKEKFHYEESGFTDDDPVVLRRMRDLKNKMNEPVNFPKGIDANTPFHLAMDVIRDLKEVDIRWDNSKFKADNNVETIDDMPVKLDRTVGVSLGTVLQLLAAQVGGTWIIRRDYIEITTPKDVVRDKVIRVYPAADLTVPIPNSVNLRTVQQQLTILGTFPGLGLQLGSPLALGALGAGGALGAVGALGALGAVGALGALGALGGIGGLGALGIGGGLGGGALGIAGGGLGGAGGGFGGGLGFGGGGQTNLGAGGGQLGFGGGQLGQFGNLGGQFGLQGGSQAPILIELIRQVVGQQREWMRPGFFQRGAGQLGPGANVPGGQPGIDDEETDKFAPELLNSVGYYPPSLALVVKGSSRIHTNLISSYTNAAGPVGQIGAANRRDDGGQLARGGAPGKGGDQAPGALAAAKGRGQGSGKNDAFNALNQLAANSRRKDNNQAAAKTTADRQAGGARAAPDRKRPIDPGNLDPKKIWQDALAKGVDDPGLIIAVTDFLEQRKLHNHVVEFLKANLRQGIVTRPWVYEALATAMELNGNDPAEIERARVSVVDLEPQDAQGYVRASKAMADMKRYDRAVAFCRQAALLEPNVPLPYEEGLLYAQLAKDADAMEWAAGNLLRQDWPAENRGLHDKAQRALRDLTQTLEQQSKKGRADRLLRSVHPLTERDLVVELSWEGDTDLDLEVREPIGTVCSFLQRQTPGGGILLGDSMADHSREAYIAARAYPGEYQLTIRRVWGRPVGGKATLEIIQHQGTPRESHRRETVVFDRSQTTTIVLDEGRRTSAEYVPPPGVHQKLRRTVEELNGAQVMTKLRNLADPGLAGRGPGLEGDVAAPGIPISNPSATPPAGASMPIYQTKLPALVGNNFDLTAQTTVSADGSTTWLKVSPVFQGVNHAPAMPAVNNPLLPGSLETVARP
jgi:hypothetical protein